MRAVVVYHRQFKIAVERCGHYPLPIHQTNRMLFDLAALI